MPVLDFSKAQYSFSVGGRDFAIIDFSLEMGFGVPPKIVCSAVPKKYTELGVVGDTNAQLFWQHVAGADRVVGKPNVNLSISSLGPDSDFNFNAQGWVLADVGLTAAATASQPAAIEFTILHPIALLHQYPAHAGPTKQSPRADQIKGTQYIDILKSALQLYSRFVADSAKKEPAYKNMIRGISELDKYLKCEGCNAASLTKLFDWMSGESRKNCFLGFKKYILSCVTNGAGGPTLYAFAAQNIAAELSLGLYVDPDDISSNKMILKPRVPYTPDCLHIKQNSVTMMTNSHGDWMAASGLYVRSDKIFRPKFNAPQMGGIFNSVNPSFASVMAKDGGVQTVSATLPGWFDAMLNYAYVCIFNAPGEIRHKSDLDLSNENHVKATKKVLTQYFLDMYKQTKNITISRLFSMKDDKGKLLVPGKSCELSDGKSRGLVFLVSSVSHKFSLLYNTATTQISGNYVRGANFSVQVEGAENESLISNGFSADKNYIWG